MSLPVRGSSLDTVTGTERTRAVPSGAVPVKRTSWAPAAVLSGTWIVPVTVPLAFAVSVARRTGALSSSTVTAVPGAYPPQLRPTDWPTVRVVSATVQAGARVELVAAVELVDELPGTVELLDVDDVGAVELLDEVLDEDDVGAVELVEEVLLVGAVELVDELLMGAVELVEELVLLDDVELEEDEVEDSRT